MASGWTGESQRHALARKGIKTGNRKRYVRTNKAPVKKVDKSGITGLSLEREIAFDENFRDIGYGKDDMADFPRKRMSASILSDVQELSNFAGSKDQQNALIDNSAFQYYMAMDKNDEKEWDMYNKIKNLKKISSEQKLVEECNNIKRQIFKDLNYAEDSVLVGDKIVWYSNGNRHISKVVSIRSDLYLQTDYHPDGRRDSAPVEIRKDFIEKAIPQNR